MLLPNVGHDLAPPPTLPLFSAADLENYFYCPESVSVSSLGVLVRPWGLGPAKCIVSVALSSITRVLCPGYSWAEQQWDMGPGSACWRCDLWFHSETIPDWPGRCTQSHLVGFSLFMLTRGQYFAVSASFLDLVMCKVLFGWCKVELDLDSALDGLDSSGGE